MREIAGGSPPVTLGGWWARLPSAWKTTVILAVCFAFVVIPLGLWTKSVEEPAGYGDACFVAQRIQQKSMAAYTGEAGMSVQTATGLLYAEMRDGRLTETQREGFRMAWGEVVTTGNIGSAGSGALGQIEQETCK